MRGVHSEFGKECLSSTVVNLKNSCGETAKNEGKEQRSGEVMQQL